MLGGADDHLVRARRRAASETGRARPRAEAPSGSIELARPVSRWPAGRRLLVRGLGAEHRIEVRHRARGPAGRVRRAAAGPVGPDLGRGAVLAPLAERAPLARRRAAAPRARGSKASGRSARPGARIARRPVSWSMRTLGRAHAAQDRGGGSGRWRRRRVLGRRHDRLATCASSSGLSRSIGSGKTIVELLLTPISTSVCR